MNEEYFQRAQHKCSTCQPVWSAHSGNKPVLNRGLNVHFEVIDGLMYRVCVASKDPTDAGKT